MNRFKEILLQQAGRAGGTRGMLIMVVGGYFIYMASRMLINTKTGVSSMSMPLTVMLMILMILIGIAVIGYGGFLFWTAWKKEKENISEEDNP